LSEVPTLLRSLGVEPEPVLARAGLTLRSLARPENRIDFGALGRLMKYGAEATGHPQFGLLVGRSWHLSAMGVVGEVTRNCATLGEALELHTVHQQINSAGGLAFVLQRASVVDFGYAVYYPGAQGVDHLVDAALATGFNYVRELAGPAWRPAEVFLPHARPAGSSLPYRQFFGVEPRFNSEICALRFPAYWLAHPVRDASPEGKRAALARAEAVRRPGVVMQAYRGLRVLLMHGKCSGDDLAQMLAMHRRTLNRRLREAGTTFQTVLDDVRFEVARQLLSHTDMCMDDVAATLGYSSVAPFMRAFRRMAGLTPGQWRRRVPDTQPDARSVPWHEASVVKFDAPRRRRGTPVSAADDEPPLRPAA
jgi:AraC-like DNA-binding protein